MHLIALLTFLVVSFASAEKLRIMLPLTLITQPSDPEGNLAKMGETKADLQRLVGFAKKESISEPVLLLLRSGMQKLSSSESLEKKRLKKIEKAKAKAAKAGANAEEGAALSFSSGTDLGVRPLKTSMRAPKNGVGVTEHSAVGLNSAFLDLDQPFIVRGGLDLMSPLGEALRSQLSLKALRKLSNVTIEYYQPQLARVVMQQQQAATAPKSDLGVKPMEIYQPTLIDFARYFSSCFGPSKIPGPQTEHCSQTLPEHLVLTGLPAEVGGAGGSLLNVTLGGLGVNGLRTIYAARRELLAGLEFELGGDSDALAGFGRLLGGRGRAESKKTAEALMTELARKFDAEGGGQVTLGPSGSGGAGHPFLEGTRHGFLEAVVHGARRYVCISTLELQRIADASGRDFAPSPMAFGLFEEGLAEWREEYGLKVLAEFNAEPGDVVYLPPGVHAAALATEDSASVRRPLHLPEVPGGDRRTPAQRADGAVWDPTMQNWDLAACAQPLSDVAYFPGWDIVRFDAQDAINILADEFSKGNHRYFLAARAALQCAGSAVTEPTSLCARMYLRCLDVLREGTTAQPGSKLPMAFAARHLLSV